MRNLGAILLLLGTGGFFYATSQLQTLDPLPADIPLRQVLADPYGRWDMLRYASAAVAAIGLVLALFTKDS